MIFYTDQKKIEAMEFEGKTYSTFDEIFLECLRLAEQKSPKTQEFFEAYINYISVENNCTYEEAEKIAKSNIGYYAGYCGRETTELIYKTYNTKHPILGEKPYENTMEKVTRALNNGLKPIEGFV